MVRNKTKYEWGGGAIGDVDVDIENSNLNGTTFP